MADAEILSQQEEATATDTATDTATATTAAVETNDANDDTQPPLQEDQQQPPSSPPSSFDGDGSPDPEAFVNNGLNRWLAARDTWCRKPSDIAANDEKQDDDKRRHAIPVDVDGIIDVLFDPRWRGGGGGRVKVSLKPPRFSKNVPLPQMIDVLIDLWEAEGLDV